MNYPNYSKLFNPFHFIASRYKKKQFLYQIVVTGDEKWLYYANPKRKKLWVNPGQSSLKSSSSLKRNIHKSKILLCKCFG